MATLSKSWWNRVLRNNDGRSSEQADRAGFMLTLSPSPLSKPAKLQQHAEPAIYIARIVKP
jgi:hypothetical protein